MSTATKNKNAPLLGLGALLADVCPEFADHIAPFNNAAISAREEAFSTRNTFEDLLASAGVAESALTDVSALIRFGVSPATITGLQTAQAAAALAYRKASEADDELDRQTRAYADMHFHELGAAYIAEVSGFLDSLAALQPVFPAGNLIAALVPNGHRMTVNNGLTEIANLLPALIMQARAQLNVSKSAMTMVVA
jgi:hypothetical protein